MDINNYKAVIFDLDGTLLNTLEDLADSLNIALNENQQATYTLEEYRNLIGGGLKNLVEKALAESASDKLLVEKVLDEFQQIYHKNFMNKTKPYDNVEKLIRILKDRGFKLGVLSNKEHQYTVALVNHYFPQIFDQVYGLKPGYKTKPDPTTALEILKNFNLSPKQAIYVGDSPKDIELANNIGMLAVAVSWGFSNEDKLEKASLLLQEPMDLIS